MTDEELRDEYRKCLESPAYFYNNYYLVADKTTGKVSKPNPVTDEQIELARQWYDMQRRLRNPYSLGEPLPDNFKQLLEKWKKANK